MPPLADPDTSRSIPPQESHFRPFLQAFSLFAKTLQKRTALSMRHSQPICLPTLLDHQLDATRTMKRRSISLSSQSVLGGMGSLSSEDWSDSGPTRRSCFIREMSSSLEESIDTAITVSGKSFQILSLLTSSWNQSESVSPSGNMNNSQTRGMAILVIRNSRKEMHNATRTPQQTHSSPEL